MKFFLEINDVIIQIYKHLKIYMHVVGVVNIGVIYLYFICEIQSFLYSLESLNKF